MRGTRVIRARRTELGAMAVIQRSRRRGTAIMSIAVASLVVTGCAGSVDAGAPGTAASPETTSFSPFEFTPTSEAGPRAAPRWQEVGRFEGSAGNRTPAFTVDTGAIQWRLRWECQSGSMRVTTVSPPGESEPLANSSCPSEGEGFSIQTGEVHLDVEASGAWSAIVEQQVETPINEPILPQMAGAPVVAQGPFYEIDEEGKGTVTLYRLSDGRRALRLEDFEVHLNTDLVVWLSEAPRPTTSLEAVEAPHVEIGPLKSTLGPQNYVVPDDLPTNRIRSLVIWCPPIRSGYIAATLQP